jgi:hypothetical protein
MPQVTVRLSSDEHRQLLRAAGRRKMKKSAYLRSLVREQPLETVADWLEWSEKNEGRKLLRSP